MIEKIELIDTSLIEHCICEDVKNEEVEELIELGKKMIEFCFQIGAVGLAAPQIGVFKKMFVYRKTEDSFQVVFNPTFIKVSKRPIKVLESCLSYKDKNFLVERYREIQAVFYTPVKGILKKVGLPLKGEKAIYYQHEFFHTIGHTIKTMGVPQIEEKI
jgi:peptide deformylase